MKEVVAVVSGMRCRGGGRAGGGLLVVCRLGILLHGHHGKFFFKLPLHLCHAFLCLCCSLCKFCDCLSQRISIGEVFCSVHIYAILPMSHCGAPRFGEMSLVVFYHVVQEFGPFLPILRWSLLPPLDAFGIHTPGFVSFISA